MAPLRVGHALPALFFCAQTQGALGSCPLMCDPNAPPKVEVVIVAEAGCPYCQRAIIGPLNDLVNMPGIADIMNVVHHPFGNNYYATPTCGGAPYRKDVRACWTQMCVMVPNPPAECFGDSIVTQHGVEEVQINRIEACAKRYAPNWQVYWPFMVCMEREYAQGMAAYDGCVGQTTLDSNMIMECYSGIEGDQAMIEEATTSIHHTEVPYIIVNGRPIKKETAVAEVCAAYNGPKPAGCQDGAMPLQDPPVGVPVPEAPAPMPYGYGVIPQPAQAAPVANDASSWWPPQWT